MSAHVAGRELDALVAEKVMGWVWRRSNVTGRRCLYRENQWPEWMDSAADGTEPLVGDWATVNLGNFSTDIAAAWQVVERMQAFGWDMTLLRLMDGHLCRFNDMEGRYRESRVNPREGTAALAICRAALAALSPTPDASPDEAP